MAAAPAQQPATAARLLDAAVQAGGPAAGLENWGLQRGARADLLVLDTLASGLRGVPASHQLDALVFASHGAPFQEVWVAGRRRIAQGRHVAQDRIAGAFEAAMQTLWEIQEK